MIIKNNRLAAILLTTMIAYGLISGCELGEDEADADAQVQEQMDVSSQDVISNESVAALLSAASKCVGLVVGSGQGGWQPVIVNQASCTQWIPSTWLILGQPGAVSFASDLYRSAHYFNHSLESSPGLAINLGNCRDTAIELLSQAYGISAVEIHVDNWSGIDGIQVGEIVFTANYAGTEIVGLIRNMFRPCDPAVACPVSTMGFWMPSTETDIWTCTLSQVDVSLSCP
jgi:hypothetical protein